MPARILPPTPENIALAAEALLRGDVVAMPTETVYGLAGLALDEGALAKIFSTKDRPTFDPLIVHVAAPLDELALRPMKYWKTYLEDELELIERDRYFFAVRLLTTLWPGPLTIVLPKTPRVPDLATAGLPTVAIRVPRHPVAQALLREVGQPLAAPSANRFGRISPTCAEDVAAELGDRIDIILDGGPCEIGLESTVVQVDPASDQVTLLRPGFYTREFLESELRLRVALQQTGDTSNPAVVRASPGMLASHYAPAKPLYLLPTAFADLTPEQREKALGLAATAARVGLLRYTAGSDNLAPMIVRTLSNSGDPVEAARNLFRSLRELDTDSRVDVILAEPVPDETGLWYAIADRLRRASRPWG